MLLIPRTFHRIWLGNNPMPQEYIDFGNTWLAHHPGWTLHTWTDSHASQLMNSDAFHGSVAQSGKANVLRYEILLRYGGVYIDTDFECLKNIEPLLQGVSCFVALQSPEVANNAILGSVPGHAFLRDLVQHIPARVKALSGQPSIKQSGPYFLTERLRGRTDVTVFPAKWFYPYQWHERWRRFETFPEAYAAHHWALSWRKRSKSQPCSTSPDATVVLTNTAQDALRLQWVLEGLCEQTASGKFDVLLMDPAYQDSIRALANGYRDRMSVYYSPACASQRGLLSEEVQRCIRSCRGARVILLDGRCVPDPQVVAAHIAFGDQAIVGFSRQRLYPPQKLFPFLLPLDYDALKMHSIPDPGGPQAPHASNGHADWRLIAESCISVPRSELEQLNLPQGLEAREGGRWVARELTSRNHRLEGTPEPATVTRLL